MPAAYKHILGFFQLVNDVPGYEEMEFRRPELKGEEKERNPDGRLNGAEEVIDVGSQNGTIQTDGGRNAPRRRGWVEEADDEGEMGKID